MAMYAIGTYPLITKIQVPDIHQIWYADDSASSGSLSGIKKWWDLLNIWGPKFGYYPNSLKTKLLVKEEFKMEAWRNGGMEECLKVQTLRLLLLVVSIWEVPSVVTRFNDL